MSESIDYRNEIIAFLEKEGLVLTPLASGDEYAVHGRTRRAFFHRPVFTLPADLLAEYLQKMSEKYADQQDPLLEALSLTRIHAMEYLTTDHGGGLNATTALGFRRTDRGDVEFFVDQDRPKPGTPAGSGDELTWVADPDNGAR